MNWLAHVFLSEPHIEFRLGNLLADLVKRHDLAGMSSLFIQGSRRHQVIDAFTDSHPVVHRSRARIQGNYHHTRGIIVDVFYDHFLALNWGDYCGQSLQVFTAGVYADIRANPLPLPSHARDALGWMLQEDRLSSYRTAAGIESALFRISERLSSRLGKPFALDRAVAELHENFADLQSDFREFFLLLQAHLQMITLPDVV